MHSRPCRALAKPHDTQGYLWLVIGKLLQSTWVSSGQITADHSQYADGDQVTKTIVFSQFRGALGLLEDALRGDNTPYLRLDGSMSIMERADVVRDFGRKPEVGVPASLITKDTPSFALLHKSSGDSLPR